MACPNNTPVPDFSVYTWGRMSHIPFLPEKFFDADPQQIPTGELWDDWNVNPTRLQVFNRLCDLEQFAARYHGTDKPAPLWVYQEMDRRREQLQIMR